MEPEDEDVDWLVSEVHMVHEVPASSGDVAGELYLSRFPLYTDVGAVDGEKEPQDADDDEAGVDEEGDLVVPRRRAVSTGDERRRQVTGVVTLLHALRTTLPAVGLQVWRGSLVLADYIMREQDAGRWHDVHALELGAGAGLAGLIMARHASRVWFTDYDDEVLANCEKNGQLNRHLFAHEDVVRVRKLDWLAPPPAWFRASPTNAAEPAVRPAADHSGDEAAGPPYEWTQADVAECQRISVLLAADVIYEDHLTTALFGLLEEMLRGDRVLVLSIEKRINFTLEDLAPTSKAYDHFRSFFVDLDAEPCCSSSPPST